MDWWPWVRDGEAKYKTYVYTIPEGADFDAKAALGTAAYSLKTNFVLLGLLAILLLDSPNYKKQKPTEKNI